MPTYSSWRVSGTPIDYVPIEKPVNGTVDIFSDKNQGSVPPTSNKTSNTGQYILAQDGTWIPQPAFTSGGSDAFEILRPHVLTPTYSAYTPTVTDSDYAYDVDTNHATTFGRWECPFEYVFVPITDTLLFSSFDSKSQTWSAATINISRAYGYFNDGEASNATVKVTSVKVEFSTDNGSTWTTIVTDLSTDVPLTATTSSYTFTTTPTMSNVKVRLTLVRGAGGSVYDPDTEAFIPGSTGDIDLKLYDIWISGTYAGGAGNITCNNLTVTGDATFQNKIYDSTASSGSTGQVLKVAANGKVTWATDSAGTGTVTSITTTGANGVTISGGSTQTITTSGTFALALGNITPTSISTGTGSFSGDVEFAASIKSPNGSNSPIVISPDGTGDLHVNADSLRLGDNNANATIATNGTGDLILTTHENSATEGVIRLYDGANGNITLTPNGTGQVQVGSDQVVTLTASQTLTNKTLSSNSVWNGNTIGVAYGGTGLTSLTAGYIPYGNGTSAFGSSANLFWDSTNSRLGVGTATPADKLQIAAGRILLDQDYQLTWQNAGTNRARMYGDSGNNIVFENGSSNTERMRITSAGNVGIGVVPSAWGASRKAIELGYAGSAFYIYPNTSTALGSNHYVNSSGNNIYSNTGYGAALYNMYSGEHQFYVAGSGTAGNTITFTQAMTLTSSGNLGVGTASPDAKLSVNGVGSFGSGTAALPSIAQFGDLDTGRWSPAANTLAWSTGGSERMRITSGGELLIGTSSATYGGQLTVRGSGITVASFMNSNFVAATSGTQLNVNVGATTGNTNFQLQVNSGGGLAFNDLCLQPSGGNVGIGTSSPRAKLDVSGNIYTAWSDPATTFIGMVYVDGADYRNGLLLTGNGRKTGIVSKSADSTGYIWFGTGSSETERMRITSGGDVLVNATATADSSKLYVAGNLGTNGSQFNFRPGSGTQYELVNRVGAGFDFYVNNAGTLAARLDSSGNLGIGTSSPAFKLHTYIASGTSMFKFESGANAGIYGYWTRPNQSYIQALNLDNNGDKDFSLYDATNGQVADRYYPSSTGYRAFFTNGSERMRIDSSGNVGIGTSSTTFRLDVQGSSSGYLEAIRFKNTNSSGYLTTSWTVGSAEATIRYAPGSFFKIGPDSGDTTSPVVFATNNGTERMRIDSSQVKATVPFIGNSGTKGFGAVTTTTSTSTPTGGSSGDHYYIY